MRAGSPGFRRFAALLARLGLSAGYLSGIADRFGVWGRPGAPHVTWGDFQHFITYVETLNPLVPSSAAPAVAWVSTVLEAGFGLGLLIGVRTGLMALGSGCLLLLLGLSMAASLPGVHAALACSVFSAAGASMLLAHVAKGL